MARLGRPLRAPSLATHARTGLPRRASATGARPALGEQDAKPRRRTPLGGTCSFRTATGAPAGTASRLHVGVHQQRAHRLRARTLIGALSKSPLAAAAATLTRRLPVLPATKRKAGLRDLPGRSLVEIEQARLAALGRIASATLWAAQSHASHLPAINAASRGTCSRQRPRARAVGCPPEPPAAGLRLPGTHFTPSGRASPHRATPVTYPRPAS